MKYLDKLSVLICMITGLALLTNSSGIAQEEDTLVPTYRLLWEDEKGDSLIDFNLDRPNIFRFKSEDVTAYLGGRLVLDGNKYSYANKKDSGLDLDDARIYFWGEYRDYSWWIEPDLVGVDTPRNLYEAWGSWEYDARFKLTVGQMRVALGSEFGTREENLPLVGYGFTSYLDGRYDTGVRNTGSLMHGILWFQNTIVAGHGFGLEGQRRESAQYSTRLVYHPFSGISPERRGWRNYLQGFFLGVAVAHSPDYDDPIILTTPLESVVFTTPDLDGEDTRWLHLEAGWALGPVCFGFERISGKITDIPVGPIGSGFDKTMDQFISWTVYGAWNLTGEQQLWSDGGWQASHVYGRDEKKLGGLFENRWELAARYSNADIDRDLFVYGITSYDPSTQEVRTFSLDLNWYPIHHTRVALQWVKTIADDELTTFGDTNRDSSYVLRLDLIF